MFLGVGYGGESEAVALPPYLCLAEGYTTCVKEARASINLQPYVYNLHRKLNATHGALIRWNRNPFGNIFDRKSGIELEVINLEESLVHDWNQVDFYRW